MNRKGFTLTEVLVTLAIVSVVAAVVVPALNSQLFKGDVGRVTSDLNAIKTGIQSFVADVRRYPAKISDLTIPITGSGLDAEGNAYTTTNADKWKGPYIDRDLVASSQSGFGGLLTDSFERVSGTTSTTHEYLSINITNMTEKNFDRLDDVIDQGTGVGSGTGTLRYTTANSGTVKYLAVPIQ